MTVFIPFTDDEVAAVIDEVEKTQGVKLQKGIVQAAGNRASRKRGETIEVLRSQIHDELRRNPRRGTEEHVRENLAIYEAAVMNLFNNRTARHNPTFRKKLAHQKKFTGVVLPSLFTSA